MLNARMDLGLRGLTFAALLVVALGIDTAGAQPAGDPAAKPGSSAAAPAAEPSAAPAEPTESTPMEPAPSAAPSAPPTATAPPKAAPSLGSAPPTTPVEPTPAPLPATTAAAEPPPATTGTDWPFIGGIVALAGGVGLLVVGHYALFRLGDLAHGDEMAAYRKTVPEGQSSCDAAKAGYTTGAADTPSPGTIADLCDEADTMEVLQYVALPVGVVATVAGLLLIGTSDTVNGTEPSEQASRWRWNVGVGPRGGAASLSVSWF